MGHINAVLSTFERNGRLVLLQWLHAQALSVCACCANAGSPCTKSECDSSKGECLQAKGADGVGGVVRVALRAGCKASGWSCRKCWDDSRIITMWRVPEGAEGESKHEEQDR